MQTYMQTKAILSLVYKLVNESNFILFGGIVRDIIIPSVSKGLDPFEKKFKPDAEISDIDMTFVPDEKYSTDLSTRVNDMFPKFREWDWRVNTLQHITTYGGNGLRIFISHCWAEIVTHIDFVPLSTSHQLDFDVNLFRFSKEKGLHTCMRRSKILLEQIVLFRTSDKIMRKSCKFLLPVVSDDEAKDANSAKRFVKMLKKGWKIENIGATISVVEETKDGECQICGAVPNGRHIVLTCSSCRLCFDCFQGLIESKRLDSCICPTCRQRVVLWTRE